MIRKKKKSPLKYPLRIGTDEVSKFTASYLVLEGARKEAKWSSEKDKDSREDTEELGKKGKNSRQKWQMKAVEDIVHQYLDIKRKLANRITIIEIIVKQATEASKNLVLYEDAVKAGLHSTKKIPTTRDSFPLISKKTWHNIVSEKAVRLTAQEA